MNMHHGQPQSQTYTVGPAPAPTKQIITVENGGANRGARENLRAFAEFNLTSEAASLVPVYSDPAPGRARALAEEAAQRGISARGVEGKVEDVVLSHGSDPRAPIILNLDRASAIANVLTQTAKSPRATLGYLLLKLPSGRLWAVRFVLEAHNETGRAAAVAFFERLAEVSERNTSADILGEAADPAHVLAEPAIRAWFAAHTKANLAKIVAGVEPATATFEVTMDGHETLPLLIAVREGWSNPGMLAAELLENPASPIRRGTQFVVAEVTGEGIRLHAVRRRTDDRVTVAGAEVIDRATVNARQAEESARREQAAAQARASAAREAEAAARRKAADGHALAEEQALVQMATAALAVAARETLSRRNPVMTTD
jgi:hypothetical protein